MVEINVLRFLFLWVNPYKCGTIGIEKHKNCIIQHHTICSSFLAPIPNNIC